MVGPSVSAMVRSIHPGKGRMVGPSVSAMYRSTHPGKGMKWKGVLYCDGHMLYGMSTCLVEVSCLVLDDCFYSK